MSSPQDRRLMAGETKQLIPGASVDFAIPRAADIDIHSILIRVNATINNTVAWGAQAIDYAQLLGSFQLIADGEVIQQGTGRYLALGQQYRSTLFTYNTAPAVAVGNQTLQHAYILDMSSVDCINPKDSILRTGLYSNLVLRITAPQVADLYSTVAPGAGTFTNLTASLSYRASQEYGQRSIPFIRTVTNLTGIDLSAAHGLPGLETKLSATGAGTWIKGLFIETYNASTRVYTGASVTNFAIGQQHDKWVDIPAADQVAWNSWDVETVPRSGTYLIDFTRVSEGPARLTDARDMSNIAEPRLWLANLIGANNVADVHVYGFKLARQP
jgi:hypothetical protein